MSHHETKTFLGMKIEGEVFSEKHVDQRSKEDLGTLIQDVIRLPKVNGLAWCQATPYFNDGEPCVFHAQDIYISVEGIEMGQQEYYDYSWQEEDAENGRHWLYDWDDEFKRLIGTVERKWVDGVYSDMTNFAEAPYPALLEAFTNLTREVGSGAFNHALLELFGDHARILIDAKTQVISVESYEHD